MVRKNPADLARSIMDVLESDPQTVNDIAKAAGCAWITAWKYLELMSWIQACPKVGKVQAGKRIELWRREWGRLPP